MTSVINFSDLINRHGEIEAMRQLEAIEAIAYIQNHLVILAKPPEERLETALQHLTAA